MTHVFRVFPNQRKPVSIKYAYGPYLYTSDSKKILDTSSGGTSYAILGWGNKKINQSIANQLKKFSHIDYKLWTDKNLEVLSNVLLSDKKNSLDKVYFSGNSGAEACEAAMKMSFQSHYDSGYKKKQWFISRKQSYHGATTDALSLGERPNLAFFKPLTSLKRKRIPMHHPKYMKKKNETLDQYAKRSALELEKCILKLGEDNVAAFVGETIMGGLVGDVPPAPNYWKYIRKVCDKYNIHLILDEVYCGTGTSGKIYCCDWDNITPDFLFIGKTLAAGYGSLSAVITKKKYENIIKKGQGRLQHTTTHQGHSLSAAAALAVQKIIHQENFLKRINKFSNLFFDTLRTELKDHEFFYDLRGRGFRFSVEHRTEDNISFSEYLTKKMYEKYSILINSKWHRTCFTPPLILKKSEVENILEKFIKVFKSF